MEIFHYLTRSGRNVFLDWLDKLEGVDIRAAVKVVRRIDRLADGNFGDCKPIREGIWEMRIDHGPGYRVYYGIIDQQCVLLVCGGDKRTQSRDIDRALRYWRDYQQRTSR